MKPISRIYCLLFLFFIIIMACTKRSQYIDTISPAENPYLLQLDSFSGNFTSFRADSFVTSSAATGLAGFCRDPLLGTIWAAHYWRYQLPEWTDIANNTAFDSLELVLKLNHAYTGDSLAAINLSVDRLSQSISNDQNIFYNTTAFSSAAGRLGDYSQVIRPLTTDSIRILLSPLFGAELFNHLKARNDVVGTEDKFNEYFKGLRLSGDSSQPAMLLQFKDSISMHLHYHENAIVNLKKTITFNKAGSPYRFNQVRQNFSGTAWAGLNAGSEIATTLTGNQFALEEFYRLRTRISFPDIKSVLQASDYVKVMAASLEIKPATDAGHNFPLPPGLQLFLQKEDGTLEGPLTGIDGNAQNGGLFIDAIYGKDTRYLFDISDYILSELSADNFTSTKLVLAGNGTDSSLNRLVANTTAASNLRSRLILTVLVYKKQS